jgi:regulator of sigma E protease
MTLLIFVLVFGGIVFVHELGHFLAARLFKIEVEEFGFGLPPKVMTLFTWQRTEFTLNALPLGGFVRPKGENDPNVLDGLASASPWKRLVVLFAGPFMNLLTAVVVIALLIGQAGVPVDGPVTITSVDPGSPAHWAMFEPGDVLVSINGQEILQSAAASRFILQNKGTPLEFVVLRDGQEITLRATPGKTRNPNQGALGIGLQGTTRPATLGEMVVGGVAQTIGQSIAILSLPVLLVQGLVTPEEARPIGLKGIYDIFGQAVTRDTETRLEAQQAAQSGETAPPPSNWVLSLIAMLSISLGVFNLLPIPALDGGRILFTLPEIFLRRRIPYQLENVVNGVALILLIGLMLVVNLMDFINPINFNLR